MSQDSDLLASLRRKSRLWAAWRHVYHSGIRSRSRETREEVKAFQEEASLQLDRMERRLRRGRFRFDFARGIAQRRKGKSERPIVQARVEDRIVQRAILDVLQEQTSVAEAIQNPNSFGGIKHRGVRQALEAAHSAIEDGAKYYMRSDIKQFFTQIPKSGVIERLRELIDDEPFVDFVESALKVELGNLEDLGHRAELFPLDDEGVPQGCCLSPLAGNLLLTDFDRQMNDRGIVCVRYIDDFILLGPSEQRVRKAFGSARDHLEELGLGVYDPDVDTTKGRAGEVRHGFELLGCRVRADQILPSREARGAFLNSIQTTLDDSIQELKNPGRAVKRRRTITDTLQTINRIAQGWGNQYAYCNGGQFFRQLDYEIDKKIRLYLKKCERIRGSLEREDRRTDSRRVLGVHAMVDSKRDPIVQAETSETCEVGHRGRDQLAGAG